MVGLGWEDMGEGEAAGEHGADIDDYDEEDDDDDDDDVVADHVARLMLDIVTHVETGMDAGGWRAAEDRREVAWLVGDMVAHIEGWAAAEAAWEQVCPSPPCAVGWMGGSLCLFSTPLVSLLSPTPLLPLSHSSLDPHVRASAPLRRRYVRR